MADFSGNRGHPKMSICNGLMALGTPLATGVAGLDVQKSMPDVLVPAGVSQPAAEVRTISQNESTMPPEK